MSPRQFIIGLMESTNVRLKEQLEELPESSVATSEITVSE